MQIQLTQGTKASFSCWPIDQCRREKNILCLSVLLYMQQKAKQKTNIKNLLILSFASGVCLSVFICFCCSAFYIIWRTLKHSRETGSKVTLDPILKSMQTFFNNPKVNFTMHELFQNFSCFWLFRTRDFVDLFTSQCFYPEQHSKTSLLNIFSKVNFSDFHDFHCINLSRLISPEIPWLLPGLGAWKCYRGHHCGIIY